MIYINQWAQRWNVSPQAIQELRELMGQDPTNSDVNVVDGRSENAISSHTRLNWPKQTNGVLWRNNVGAMQDETGRVVRFGLANESKKMNEQVKSSDLIGIRPIEIMPFHIGKIIGQFVAIETKEEGWRYTGTKREAAQRKFHEIVISKGGYATFVSEIDHNVNKV